MKDNPTLLIGIIIIATLSLMAILAPVVSPYDPAKIDRHNLLIGPSGKHLMGTDSLGRDLFSRIVLGPGFP